MESNKWKYPRKPIKKIYKKKIFELFPNYKIKDLEQTHTTTKDNKNILIKPLCGNKICKPGDKYKFLHLGLIQVAVKPLARKGLGAPLVVCLRDNRHRDFHDSLLAMVELDSADGSFYFNCTPNLTISLEDANLSELLHLQMKTNMIPLAVSYRVVVKKMPDLEDTKALLPFCPGETTYYQAQVCRDTPWGLVHVPESWIKVQGDREQEEANAVLAAAAKNFARSLVPSSMAV